MNTLYYGDCLTVIRDKMQPESVDLVYLDPPFNSKRDYNNIYKDHTGRPLPDQVEAYTDTWVLDAVRMRTIRKMPKLLREHAIDGHDADFLARFLSGLVNVQADMAAYLSYITERLLWIKWVMKPTASIYLHGDPAASHYLKIVMDVLFGRRNFQNEFIWYYSGGGASKKRWARKHDILLFYTNSKKWQFNVDAVRTPHKWDKGQLRADGSERDYAKGKIPDDVWQHHSLLPWSNEWLDFKTQKPLALLERVIKASSSPGDVVFDPFCGCATTVEASNKLGRHWIGIDITIHAIRRVARRRLFERMGLTEGEDYVIDGVPKNWEGAFELWKQDHYQFQKWCVEKVDGFVNVKKTADDGIDGRIYFDMPGEKIFQSMALEVKGGENVRINDLRSLNTVLQFENIQMAGLITLHEPSERQLKNFKQTMAMAGDIEIDGKVYPRRQLLTVNEIINGAKFNMPSPAGHTGTGYEGDLFNEPPI